MATNMDSGVSCLELALEGERLCKIGDFNGGVAFFEAAVKCGTNDMKTLSAIYSQLGNAYFYLGNYPKAMEYHKLDLSVAKSINDRIGEAKASGNLGNTLKMMNQYDSAVSYCKKHLDIARELNDKVGEGRALYNLGNIYHTKAKNLGHLSNHDPGNFPQDVEQCLEMAIKYYKENLELMINLGDHSAQGRTYGNLGNTYYLLGNFSQAVEYHQKRLEIAVQFKDRAAERRAHCNLGNAHIFLGEFEKAIENYKQTLLLAEKLQDQLIEAQACYSLGNTYVLLRNFDLAIEYYQRHLAIAKKINDRIGEGRAYWSLSNAMQAIGNHQKAMEYVQKHLEISKEIGDLTGQENAEISISKLRQKLNTELVTNERVKNIMRPKRISMNKLELLNLTPDQQRHCKNVDETCSTTLKNHDRTRAASFECVTKGNEDFFELLSKFQSKRMDDQRCSIEIMSNNNKENIPQKTVSFLGETNNNNDNDNNGKKKSNYIRGDEAIFDLIAVMQDRRMDDQRATLPQRSSTIANHHSSSNGFPSNLNKINNPNNSGSQQQPSNNMTKKPTQRQYSLNQIGTRNALDDDFFDMLIRSQANRLEDQRTEMPSSSSSTTTTTTTGLLVKRSSEKRTIDRPISVSSTQSNTPTFAPTVPDEDFFNLIMRFQSNRIEDQRSVLPTTST
ncbi:G-protein-signaling modulator pins [Dermatophagoides pteronyssinus]|uniref:G-protein-signaling modulator pins n=1 Tax=Dermatophagoides pteronyssinus TaxID=6956 RepID=UPI003F6755CF